MEEGKRCKQDRSSRRRALEEELAKILAQKAAVEERVAQLRKRAQAAAVDKEAQPSQVEVAREANSSKHKQFPKEKSLHQLSNGGLASGSKRPFPEQAQQPPRLLPGSVHEEYNSKKQEIETGRQRRMHNIWNHCVSILRSLKKMSGSHPFLKPVDPVALNIPDYFDIIKKPMDLGTIEKKLAHNPSKNQYREYDDPLQFRDDVRLVFNNCRTYNQPQHEVTKLGEKLSEAFEKKWATSNVEGLIAQDKAFRTREDLTLAELEASLSGNQSTDCAQKLRKISEELKAELSGKAAVSTGVENGASGKMTFEQKRLLSIALGSLPGDKLYRVLEIVSESNGISPEDEEEVELDIDSLDDRTLRKLQDYVNSVASAQMGGQRTTSKSAAAVQSKDTAPASHHEHQTTGGKAPAAAHPQEEHRVAPSADGKGSDSGYSSSSSDDSSSSSGSDSKGEEQRGSTLNGEGAATGGAGFDKGGRGGDMGMEASALVSATRPSAPPQRSIVKTHASSKKGVNLQNAGAWESLTQGEQGDNEERADGLQGQEVDKSIGADDPLWTQFTAREQQLRKREEDRRHDEKQIEAERQRRERAQWEQAWGAEGPSGHRHKSGAAEPDPQRLREEERAKELAQLTSMGKGAADISVAAEEDDMMKAGADNGGGGLALLGLSMKYQDDDDLGDDDYDSSSQDDMEDGEVN